MNAPISMTIEPALEPHGIGAYSFSADGIAVVNPFASLCSRFEVTPAQYGFVDSGSVWARRFTLDGKPVVFTVSTGRGGDVLAECWLADAETRSVFAKWEVRYSEEACDYTLTPTDPTVRLAAAFARVLQSYLTPQELAEVNRRNAAETSPDVCHSHDFCDANMAMDAAFSEVFGRSVSDTPDGSAQQQQDFDAWNAAWEIASDARFGVPA